MKIIKLEDSQLKSKRFRVYLDNNKHYDFGLKDKHETYIDHKDKVRRDNYRRRHYNSIKEQPYIINLVPSPALFSYYLLWGDSTSLQQNIKTLNKIFKQSFG